MESQDIKNLVSKMTLEEKAGLCSGEDFWHTKAVERLNIPAIMMSDGPYGLRKQEAEADHLGIMKVYLQYAFRREFLWRPHLIVNW